MSEVWECVESGEIWFGTWFSITSVELWWYQNSVPLRTYTAVDLAEELLCLLQKRDGSRDLGGTRRAWSREDREMEREAKGQCYPDISTLSPVNISHSDCFTRTGTQPDHPKQARSECLTDATNECGVMLVTHLFELTGGYNLARWSSSHNILKVSLQGLFTYNKCWEYNLTSKFCRPISFICFLFFTIICN